MLDTVDFNHVQHISFTQSRLTDAVSVILSELLSYEHPSKGEGFVSSVSRTFPPQGGRWLAAGQTDEGTPDHGSSPRERSALG